MSSRFHSPISFWLDLTIEDMLDWARVASIMAEEERQKHNVQTIGPGL